jgi:hypothetical protein
MTITLLCTGAWKAWAAGKAEKAPKWCRLLKCSTKKVLRRNHFLDHMEVIQEGGCTKINQTLSTPSFFAIPFAIPSFLPAADRETRLVGFPDSSEVFFSESGIRLERHQSNRVEEII